MIKELKCPTCNGPLEYEEGQGTVIACPFCGGKVVLAPTIQAGIPSADPSGAAMSAQLERLKRVREVADLARAGRKIEAIKLFRQLFGVDLRTAKESVEKIEAGQPVEFSQVQVSVDGAGFPAGREQLPPVVQQALQGRLQDPAAAGGTARPRTSSGCAVPILLGASALGVAVVGVIVYLLAGSSPRPAMKARDTIRMTSTVPGGRGSTGSQAGQAAQAEAGPPLPGKAGPATLLMTFGQKGSGPGQFTRPEHVAVGGDGAIYVGDVSDGRVQVFDPSGKYVTQWAMGNKSFRGLAADGKGNVFVAYDWDLYRIEGKTGARAGQLKNKGAGGQFRCVAVAPDGRVVAAWGTKSGMFFNVPESFFWSDILLFDAGGKVRKTVKKARTEIEKIAVDKEGTIYATQSRSMGSSVYKFSSKGAFLGAFKTGGREIAVDGKGRVYVGGGRIVQVLDPDGRELGRFDVGDVVEGLAVDGDDALFVVTGAQEVKKFKVDVS